MHQRHVLLAALAMVLAGPAAAGDLKRFPNGPIEARAAELPWPGKAAHVQHIREMQAAFSTHDPTLLVRPSVFDQKQGLPGALDCPQPRARGWGKELVMTSAR